jgi:hypothetical protein
MSQDRLSPYRRIELIARRGDRRSSQRLRAERHRRLLNEGDDAEHDHHLGQDLSEPDRPGHRDNDAIGRPDGGPGIGNDRPTSPIRHTPLAPAAPGIPGGIRGG